MLLTKSDMIRGSQFSDKDLMQSMCIQNSLDQIAKFCPAIPENQIHPHTNILGIKDYPNISKEAIQMNVLDILINAAESFLRRVLRNPLRIIDKETNKCIHYFFTNCIDEPLSELRLGGRLKSFTQVHGVNFKFIDKCGD